MAAPDLRVGDADRDAALAALGEHFVAGRLSREEYDERSEAAWTARTRGDLAVLFADLPQQAGPGAGPRPGATLPWFVRVPFRPLLPLLVVLIVLSAALHLPLVLLGVALWLLVPRTHWLHGGRRAHASGSRRPSRGSWA